MADTRAQVPRPNTISKLKTMFHTSRKNVDSSSDLSHPSQETNTNNAPPATNIMSDSSSNSSHIGSPLTSPELCPSKSPTITEPPITNSKAKNSSRTLHSSAQSTPSASSSNMFVASTSIRNPNQSTARLDTPSPRLAPTKDLDGLSRVVSSFSMNSGPAAAANHVKRIIVNSDGTHEHFLKSTRRQEKLGRMLKDILGNNNRARDAAVSAMPDFVHADQLTKTESVVEVVNENKQKSSLSLMHGLINQIQRGEKEVGAVLKYGNLVSQSSNPSMSQSVSASNSSNQSFLQKYGKCQEIIGRGAYGVVRIAHKYDQTTRRDVLFAVKEFKKRANENDKTFNKRLTSEFCIGSSLHHQNIIHTLDLMKDSKGQCFQVMEYCAGGDLYSLILSSEGGLEAVEADCFFKQIVRGVVFMHSMGVAHGDLKPENILLTCKGAVKITDFGNAECFRMAWENEVHLSSGLCGSQPYIAPEPYREKEFDPRPVDIWAIGVIYMAMRTGSYLWEVSVPDQDKFYRQYLEGRKSQHGYDPIENLSRAKCRNVIYSILDPNSSRRITGKQVLHSEWAKSIRVCEAGEQGF